MHHRSQTHHVVEVDLRNLRPTQIAVGFTEVEKKRAEWRTLRKKDRQKRLESHLFPAVVGPRRRYYITDHHHVGMALLAEGVDTALVVVIDDLGFLGRRAFWRLMEFRRWAHPYDGRGRRRAYEEIPEQLEGLQDDPYRSLAGLVREAGGFAKDSEPFVEFLWADFLRGRVKLAAGRPIPPRALKEAMALARRPEARYLPGWHG